MFAKRLLQQYSPSSIKTILSTSYLKSDINMSSLKWQNFIENSIIEKSNFFEGMHFGGYILEKKEWCLDSWIWTNAAIVRLFSKSGNIAKASLLADILINKQQECGGWIVRNDYDEKGAIPVLAPNDSAYIANNAMLSLYKVSKDPRLLASAKRCADWILKICRHDGMVNTGFNTRDNVWYRDSIIVDVGFTGGLFANLYQITKAEQYRVYLSKFTNRYIELFYLKKNMGFATSIDSNDKPQGGMFARGQAWALEGLIPAYIVLRDDSIKEVIKNTIDNLLIRQNTDGSWAYNLTRPLMGNDCKGVSVIAKSLLEWNEIEPNEKLVISATKALNWCKKNTLSEGEAIGGIFSFCTEGAIVKDLYSSCALVYASAYAIEVNQILREYYGRNNHPYK